MRIVPSMRTFAVATMMTAALVGCGSSSGSRTSTTAQAAAATPSLSAKMICQEEVAIDVAKVVGIKTTRPVVPTWSHGLYSCRYAYPNGQIALSVKELSNQADTESYFATLQRLLGKKRNWANLGQGAFITANDSMVVRKDYKVLFVDISRLPLRFGSPDVARVNVAIDVAITIMGCWTGA